MRVLLLTMAAVGLLAGCTNDDDDFVSFAERTDDFEDRQGLIGSIPFTDPSTLPSSGSAEYHGTARGFLGNEDQTSMAGDLSLLADFEDDDISGSISGVVDEDNNEYDGVIQMANGAIDRTVDPLAAFTFTADADGTLVGADGADYVFDTELLGNFRDDDHEYVTGIIDGCVFIDGGACTDFLDGEFNAER